MKRILVAIDELEPSERVAEFVNDFFADIDAEILAICSSTPTPVRERNADLIVVGSHHKNVFERLLEPSVSHDVLHDTDRPVLVVP